MTAVLINNPCRAPPAGSRAPWARPNPLPSSLFFCLCVYGQREPRDSIVALACSRFPLSLPVHADRRCTAESNRLLSRSALLCPFRIFWCWCRPPFRDCPSQEEPCDFDPPLCCISLSLFFFACCASPHEAFCQGEYTPWLQFGGVARGQDDGDRGVYTLRCGRLRGTMGQRHGLPAGASLVWWVG